MRTVNNRGNRYRYVAMSDADWRAMGVWAASFGGMQASSFLALIGRNWLMQKWNLELFADRELHPVPLALALPQTRTQPGRKKAKTDPDSPTQRLSHPLGG